MNRTWLLRLFFITMVFPLVILLIIEIREAERNRMAIDNYNIILKEAGNETGNSEDTRDRLIERRDELRFLEDRLLSGYFDSGETTFFEFADLVMEKGKAAGVVIEDYQTHAESAPPAITLSARGRAEEVMEYLYVLETWEKRLPVPRLSINLDAGDREYKLNLTVNYINRERKISEAANGK